LSLKVIHSSGFVFSGESVLHGELSVLELTGLILNVNQLFVQAIEHIPEKLFLWLDALIELPVSTILAFNFLWIQRLLHHLEHTKLSVHVVDNIMEVGLFLIRFMDFSVRSFNFNFSISQVTSSFSIQSKLRELFLGSGGLLGSDIQVFLSINGSLGSGGGLV
jgi:hypothetical protein